ncbi:type VI secretion system membrane subunit TssM [Azospirillum halopraeferens]|uniref:type VI secretion system membrane subunit TssM n=1 Tax=Azospirillum halopraeferens TaxID=34010 RepID=UPI00040637BC|nr:type VI secretion system membrane subunit TssM [Azospirillum halopraeferens]
MPPFPHRALIRLPATPGLRRAMGLAGAAAAAAVLWHLAPLLSVAGQRPLEEGAARALPGLLVLGAWALAAWRGVRRERTAHDRLVATLAGLPPGDPDARAAATEIGTLRDRLGEAAAGLRALRLRGRRTLHQRPWYLLIGAPGSGKTTALAAAGLNFPPGAQPHAVPLPSLDTTRHTVGGTRTCDWWITDDAVLIDTAGRYTTQDSRHPVDSRVWIGLLDLLKEHRPQRPVNGVLVTVSLADLAAWSDGERRAYALTLHRRLQELQRNLRQRVPVYVVGTKADLLAGFSTFFDTLTPDERGQVWGITFPPGNGPGAAGPSAWFRDAYLGLLRRLDERLPERLHQEPDIARRSLAFTFPVQMASLEGPLADLLDTAFAVGPEDEALLLRGVYFTSATRGGAEVDRLAAPFGPLRTAPALPVEAGPEEPVSCFLDRLFHDVVFAEANLAGIDRVTDRRERRRQRAAIAATLAGSVAVAGYWVHSHGGNVVLINRVAAAVSVAEARLRALDTPPRSLTRVADADFAAVLPALDALRAIPAGHADRPWRLAGGLYQGDRLGGLADDVYRRALRSIFLSRIVLRLEEQLRTGWARPDWLRRSLRAYHMLGGREPLDAAFVGAWMAADWQQTLPGPDNGDRRRALGEHLATLFAIGFAAVPLDDPLIARVGEVLDHGR